MKQLRLFIPGHFEDAYLYMGWLLMLTESRTLRVVRIEDIVQSLSATLPHSSHVVRMMLSQNEWIGSLQFRSWLTDTSAVRALSSEFEDLPSPRLELNMNRFQVSENELRVNATVCLDILLYNQRLFVCTDA